MESGFELSVLNGSHSGIFSEQVVEIIDVVYADFQSNAGGRHICCNEKLFGSIYSELNQITIG